MHEYVYEHTCVYRHVYTYMLEVRSIKCLPQSLSLSFESALLTEFGNGRDPPVSVVSGLGLEGYTDVTILYVDAGI